MSSTKIRSTPPVPDAANGIGQSHTQTAHAANPETAMQNGAVKCRPKGPLETAGTAPDDAAVDYQFESMHNRENEHALKTMNGASYDLPTGSTPSQYDVDAMWNNPNQCFDPNSFSCSAVFDNADIHLFGPTDALGFSQEGGQEQATCPVTGSYSTNLAPPSLKQAGGKPQPVPHFSWLPPNAPVAFHSGGLVAQYDERRPIPANPSHRIHVNGPLSNEGFQSGLPNTANEVTAGSSVSQSGPTLMNHKMPHGAGRGANGQSQRGPTGQQPPPLGQSWGCKGRQRPAPIEMSGPAGLAYPLSAMQGLIPCTASPVFPQPRLNDYYGNGISYQSGLVYQNPQFFQLAIQDTAQHPAQFQMPMQQVQEVNHFGLPGYQPIPGQGMPHAGPSRPQLRPCDMRMMVIDIDVPSTGNEGSDQTSQSSCVRAMNQQTRGVARIRHRKRADDDEDTGARPENVYDKVGQQNGWGVPSNDYSRHRKKGALAKRPLFEYSPQGVELAVGRFYSTEDIWQFVQGPNPEGRGLLTLWVQMTPAMSNKRYNHDQHSGKCRWKECSAPKNTILKGFWRVCFDERSNKTSGKDGQTADPFVNAGYMHLFCFEKAFDLAAVLIDGEESCYEARKQGCFAKFMVQPDLRSFAHEERNPMSLTRDSDAVGFAYKEWRREQRAKFLDHRKCCEETHMEQFESNFDCATKHPRRLLKEDYLWYHLTKVQLEHEVKGRTKTRDARNGADISKHMGDLDQYLKLKNQMRQAKDRQAESPADDLRAEIEDDRSVTSTLQRSSPHGQKPMRATSYPEIAMLAGSRHPGRDQNYQYTMQANRGGLGFWPGVEGLTNARFAYLGAQMDSRLNDVSTINKSMQMPQQSPQYLSPPRPHNAVSQVHRYTPPQSSSPLGLQQRNRKRRYEGWEHGGEPALAKRHNVA